MYAQILPELILAVLHVIYYSLESFCLAFVPRRFRARKDIRNEVSKGLKHCCFQLMIAVDWLIDWLSEWVSERVTQGKSSNQWISRPVERIFCRRLLVFPNFSSYPDVFLLMMVVNNYLNICRQVVLVTGGGHGIGRALSLRFARLGCTVIIVDINEPWLMETQEMAAAEGWKVYAYVCDVSQRRDVYACAKMIQEDVGNVTILVNNAGIVVAKFLLELPDEDILNVFRTNCFAHFWVGNVNDCIYFV